jgi:hypothetical protein
MSDASDALSMEQRQAARDPLVSPQSTGGAGAFEPASIAGPAFAAGKTCSTSIGLFKRSTLPTRLGTISFFLHCGGIIAEAADHEGSRTCGTMIRT